MIGEVTATLWVSSGPDKFFVASDRLLNLPLGSCSLLLPGGSHYEKSTTLSFLVFLNMKSKEEKTWNLTVLS